MKATQKTVTQLQSVTSSMNKASQRFAIKVTEEVTTPLLTFLGEAELKRSILILLQAVFPSR